MARIKNLKGSQVVCPERPRTRANIEILCGKLRKGLSLCSGVQNIHRNVLSTSYTHSVLLAVGHGIVAQDAHGTP